MARVAPHGIANPLSMNVLVNLDVDDLGKAVTFYQCAFQLSVGRRFGAGGVELLGGTAPIYLLAKPAGTPASDTTDQVRNYARHWTPVHLDFVVEDIEAAVERALTAGATLERPVGTHPWGRLAPMADPFGHGFCFVQFLGRGYDEISDPSSIASPQRSVSVTRMAADSVRIETGMDGCVLRPWQVDDRESLVRYANNRKVWRNLTDLFPHPYTLADADVWLSLAPLIGRSVHFAIVVDGEAVGGIGVITGDGVHRHTGKFGYWLGESFWGKGIGTACARAMVRHVFATTDFVRLEAPVFAWNPASARVLEKVGFEREGVERLNVFKDGELTDTLMYAIVRPPIVR